MALIVPETIHPGLKALAGLNDAAYQRLAATLQTSAPMADGPAFASQVAREIDSGSVPGLRSIIRALLVLQGARAFNEWDASRLVRELREGLPEAEGLALGEDE